MNAEDIKEALMNGKWILIKLKIANMHENHTYHLEDDQVIERTYTTQGDDTGSFGVIEVNTSSIEEILFILQLDNCIRLEMIIKDTKDKLCDELYSTFEFIRDLADPKMW